MTERARGVVRGGDDCQNRAARRYEKCSYLWHYFRRFEPFRPSPLLTPSSLYRRRSSRRVLPCPFSHRPRLLPSAPLGSSSPHPPTGRRSYFLHPPLPRRVALHASVSLIPFFPPRRILSFAIPTRSPHSGFVREGPLHWMDVQASTAGRDHPHCRGHHFNVTLIKSNNQYLPRKKF